MDEQKKELENLKTEVASLKIRIRRIENYLLENFSDPKEYIHEDDSPDELFEEAKKIVTQYDRASASLLQRRLGIGYARAARLMDQLETAKVVGPAEGSEPRKVLISHKEKG